jgi:hypothetical protein
MKILITILAMGLFPIIFVASRTITALASEVAIPILNPVIIDDGDSEDYRILVKPEIPAPDSNSIIEKASLSLWVNIQAKDTTYVAIDAYPIATEWELENVAWNIPWDNPGGDVDVTVYSEYAISLPGQQEITIDLTDICMRWFDGRLPYYGISIAVSESSISSAQFLNGQNGDGPFASMRISYSDSIQ